MRPRIRRILRTPNNFAKPGAATKGRSPRRTIPGIGPTVPATSSKRALSGRGHNNGPLPSPPERKFGNLLFRKLTFQVSRASRVISRASRRVKKSPPLREGQIFLGRLVVVFLVVGRVSQNVAWLPLPDTYRGR